jgi:phosphoribosylformylglycinamidine synthase
MVKTPLGGHGRERLLEPLRFAVAVDVMPKEGISDPQGQTIERALPSLGFADLHGVRVGKRIELTVDAPDPETAEAIVRAACVRFLANPVIEDYRVSRATPSPASSGGPQRGPEATAAERRPSGREQPPGGPSGGGTRA